jgi:hypothetical protein
VTGGHRDQAISTMADLDGDAERKVAHADRRAGMFPFASPSTPVMKSEAPLTTLWAS